MVVPNGIWFYHGNTMVIPWDYHGNTSDLLTFLKTVVLPYEIHGITMVIPCGFTTVIIFTGAVLPGQHDFYLKFSYGFTMVIP